MKVNVKELTSILTSLKPGLASKEIIEQATHFVFKGSKVFSFNDEVAVSHPVSFEIEGAVPGREFYTFLSKLKDDEVDFEYDKETLQLLIKGKKFESVFRLEVPSLPLDEITYSDEWIDLPENFTEAVKITAMSVSRDMAAPVLTCIHIKDNFIEACDNFRLTRFYFDSDFGVDVLISGTVATQLVSYNPKKISFSDSWVHFLTDTGCTFSCRTFVGTYPDLDHIITEFKKHTVIRFPEELVETLDRAESIAEEDDLGDKYVSVEVKKDRITVTAESNIGKFKEKVEVKNRKELSFRIRIDLLQSILKHHNKAYTDEGVTRLQFQSQSMVHVIALS